MMHGQKNNKKINDLIINSYKMKSKFSQIFSKDMSACVSA